MSDLEYTIQKNERDLRLTAFHMAREILTEHVHVTLQRGGSIAAPTTEEIQREAEKILIFLKK